MECTSAHKHDSVLTRKCRAQAPKEQDTYPRPKGTVDQVAAAMSQQAQTLSFLLQRPCRGHDSQLQPRSVRRPDIQQYRQDIRRCPSGQFAPAHPTARVGVPDVSVCRTRFEMCKTGVHRFRRRVRQKTSVIHDWCFQQIGNQMNKE